MSLSVVLCTCKTSKEAGKIADKIIASGLAACVNIVGAKSVYPWRGKMQRHAETLMIIKTRTELVRALMKKIKELHSYDVPEIIELDVERTNADYEKWVGSVTKAPSR